MKTYDEFREGLKKLPQATQGKLQKFRDAELMWIYNAVASEVEPEPTWQEELAAQDFSQADLAQIDLDIDEVLDNE